MKKVWLNPAAMLVLTLPAGAVEPVDHCPKLLDYRHQILRGEESVDFCQRYAGKVLMVVNTASRCGFTPQFSDLEQLYRQYKDRGFEIVGFPSNDFKQEYAASEKTARVCYVNYGVTFTMLEASSVTGEGANAFYRRLAKESGESPKWNFHKYLIDRQGHVIGSFQPDQIPTDRIIRQSVEAALH